MNRKQVSTFIGDSIVKLSEDIPLSKWLTLYLADTHKQDESKYHPKTCTFYNWSY